MNVECQIAELVNYKKFGYIQLTLMLHEASIVLSFNQRVSKICRSVEFDLHAQVVGLMPSAMDRCVLPVPGFLIITMFLRFLIKSHVVSSLR